MIRLFIDDMECDLRNGTDVAITKQVATAFNLDTRQTDFTNRFTLPFTANNDTIMEMLRFNGSTSDRPYKTTTARLQNGSVTIADNLIIITDNVGQNGYEVRLIGSIFDFVKSMKEKKLIDTNFFDDYTHTFDIDTWKSLQGNTAGLTYTVSGGALGGIGALRVFIDMCYPAIFTNDIFLAICKEYFSIVEGDIFYKPEYLNEMTCCVNTISDASIELEKSTAEVTVFSSLSSGLNGIYFDDITKNDKLFLVVDPFAINPTTFYKPINDRSIDIKTECFITLIDGITGKLQIRKGSGSLSVSSSHEILAESEALENYGNYIPLEWSGDVLEGEYIYVCFDYYDGSNALLEVNSNLEINVSQINMFGDTFNPIIYLPDITQYDFFQDVVRRFGLIYSISNDGKLRFETFKDVFASSFGSNDWTDKLANKSQVAFSYGSYAKLNYFQFKGDRSESNTVQYNGWKEISFDNDNYTASKIIIQSIGQAINGVSGSQSVSTLGQTKDDELILLNPPLFLKTYEAPVFSVSDKILAPFNYDLYLMRNGFNSGNTGETLSLGNPLNITNIQDFEVLVSVCYGDIINSVERPEVLTADINLSETDFYFIDFFKPKYFKQFQSFYYLLKSENYIPGKVTKCTFLKIKRS